VTLDARRRTQGKHQVRLGVVERVRPEVKVLLIPPPVLSVYFLIGQIDFFPYRGHVDGSVLWLLLLAIFGYCLGVGLASLARRRPPLVRTSIHREPEAIVSFAAAWAVLGAVSVLLTLIAFGGIPLFVGEDERLQVDPKLTAMAFAGVIALVLYGIKNVHAGWRWRPALLFLGGCCVLFLLGYRTLPLLAFASTLMAAWAAGRVHLGARTTVLSVTVVFAFSWAAVPRFGREELGGYFAPLYALGMPSWFEPFAPIWLVPREGVAVLAMLQESIPRIADYSHGAVLLSSFNVFEADNLSARELVAAAVGGRPGITITPSLLGQPYMDFGLAGILFAMTSIGFILASLAFWHETAHTWAPMMAACYFCALLVLDVHSGLLDPAPLVGLLALIAFAISAESRARARFLNTGRASKGSAWL
jgi:uncharacterized membrane protein